MKAGEGYCTDVTSGGASKFVLLAQGWAQRSNSICYAAAAYGGSKLGSFDHPRNTAQINLSLKLKLEVLPTGTYQNRHRNWHRNFGPETPVHRSFRYYGRNGAEPTVISSLELRRVTHKIGRVLRVFLLGRFRKIFGFNINSLR